MRRTSTNDPAEPAISDNIEVSPDQPGIHLHPSYRVRFKTRQLAILLCQRQKSTMANAATQDMQKPRNQSLAHRRYLQSQTFLPAHHP